jgi:hypothetical protein
MRALVRCAGTAGLRIGSADQPAAVPTGCGNHRRLATAADGRPARRRRCSFDLATADTTRSDPDFAGLMLRCRDAGPEALVVLIIPLPPRARPQVTFHGRGDRVMRFDATVDISASSILLPRQAALALIGPWHALDETSIEIEADGMSIRGVVALNGLDQAVTQLMANCQTPR